MAKWYLILGFGGDLGDDLNDVVSLGVQTIRSLDSCYWINLFEGCRRGRVMDEMRMRHFVLNNAGKTGFISVI